MKKIKEGDIVARKSYDKDILFSVKKIIKNQKEDNCYFLFLDVVFILKSWYNE